MARKSTKEAASNVTAMPRITEGKPVILVQPGHRVNFVMSDGQIRPMDVVRVFEDNIVNGVLLIDGINDADNIPFFTPEDTLPHIRITDSPHRETPVCSLWATSVHYDDLDTKPGTWHLSDDEDIADGLGEVPSQEEVHHLRETVLQLAEDIANLQKSQPKAAEAATETQAPEAVEEETQSQ